MKHTAILIGTLSMLLGHALAQERMMSLEDCRKLAIQNNKELRISAEKMNKSSSDRKAAFTKYFPQVSASGAYMWNQKDINLLDMGALSSSLGSLLGPMAQLPEVGQVVKTIDGIQHLDVQNIWVGDISLVQPIFMGGKIIAYNQIAAYAKELASSMNDLLLQDVICKTDETYWQIVSLAHKKKLADTYVGLLEKMNGDVKAMLEEGVVTEADGLSVKVKLNEAEIVQTKVNNGLALSKMLLAQLCGLPTETPIVLPEEKAEDLPAHSSEVIADVNTAFMNRLELKSLDLAGKIYKRKERITLAELLPNVALSANYLITNPSCFNGFKNDFGGMFNVGVLVKVPISSWWEGTHKRNSARAETRIKSLELENAREKIELQVNQSIYKVSEAQKKLKASLRNMRSAEENLRHATLGFQEGVIPALNLMEAQTAWVSARSELIDARIDVRLTEVYLSKALGEKL